MLEIINPHSYFHSFPYDNCRYTEEEYYRQARLFATFNDLLNINLQGKIAPSGRPYDYIASVLFLGETTSLAKLDLIYEELDKYELLKKVYNQFWISLK